MNTPVSVDRALGKARLEALSDGVFAIAMTLLVLEFKIPELPHHPTNGEVLHALALLGPMAFSFTITFVLTGSFWYMHHVTFHNTRYVTRGLCAINVLFLMFISLLPFSTALLGRIGPGHPVALAVYFGNQAVLGIVLNLHWLYGRRHHLIHSPPADPATRLLIAAHPLGCVLALATVPVYPPLSYYSLVAAVAAARVIGRRRFKAMPAEAPAPI
jgi:uncharacterized membrane protein